MLSHLVIALAAVSSFVPLSIAQVAEWHMDTLNVLANERLDPIVSPNSVAGHMHVILGGSGFGASYNYQDARNARCTSASITADKSNYWMPKLYWINGNDSFVPLPAFSRFYYKLGRTSNQPVQPFPEGLRMLVGNPNAKSSTGSFSFTCHVNSDLQTGDIGLNNFNFQRDCPYGVRIESHFPPCWDGVNLYKPDQSHMAYPIGGNPAQGQCPWDHPVRLPQIMLEYTFKPSSWAPGKPLAGNLAWANGDTTGFGVHADFTNGWDTNVLGRALNSTQCAGKIGSMRIQDCEVMKPYYDTAAAGRCRSPDKGQMNEPGSSNLDLVPIKALPGCNPIWGDTPIKPGCTEPPPTPDVSKQTGTNGPLSVNNTLHALNTVPGWQELGCVKDTPNMLNGTQAYYYDDSLTLDGCLGICLSNGQRYAAVGIKNSRWNCQCGSGIRNDASWYPGMCTTPCPGNANQTCGGKDIHSIWYAPPGTAATVARVNGSDASGYLGCYSTDHSTNDNLVKHKTFQFDSTNMTNEYCLQTCANRGSTWSATTNGKTCLCGVDYVLGDAFYINDASCSYNCPGDSSQKCGGYRTMYSVYNVTQSGTQAANSTEYPDGRQGCFNDPGSKGLTGYSWVNSALTVDQCQYGCAELGYSLAGLTSGSRCRCGNAWNGGTKYPNSMCTTTCSGDKNATCGGSYLTEVYETGPVQARVDADIAARPIGWSGCFANSNSAIFRDYNRYDAGNTVERCKATCTGFGYTWAGPENKNYCKCTSVDPTSGLAQRLPSNVYCLSPCPGNSKETCGALGHYVEAYQLTAGMPLNTSTSASGSSTASTSATGSVSLNVTGSATSTGSASKTSSSSSASSTPTGGSSDDQASSSVGCFADGKTMGTKVYTSTYMTQDMCIYYCKYSGFAYAGLQGGNSCRCGDSPPSVHLGESSCTTPCVSNPDQMCGSGQNTQVWPTTASQYFVDPYTAANADENGYLGCWNDWNTRALGSSSYASSGMTPEICRTNCAAQGYTISGTESGNQCWCANELVNNKGYQRRPDSECNNNCGGDKTKKCGGSWRLSVYVQPPAQQPSSSASSTKPSGSATGSTSKVSGSVTATGSASSTSSKSASTPSSTAPVAVNGHYGCYALGSFVDSASKSMKGYASMTTQYCQRFCMAYGLPVAGLQGGNNCYCGTTSTLGQKMPAGSCSSNCAGDSSSKCGDTFMTSVYQSSPAAPGYPQDYVGCFIDSSNRQLKGYSMSSGAMTSTVCSQVCAAKGMPVYGTESGRECYCGMDLPSAMTGDGSCYNTCSGNSTEKCGGSYKLSVYKSGWASNSAPVLTGTMPASSSTSSTSSSTSKSASTSTSSTTSKTSTTSSSSSTPSTTKSSTSTVKSSTTSKASVTSTSATTTSKTSSLSARDTASLSRGNDDVAPSETGSASATATTPAASDPSAVSDTPASSTPSPAASPSPSATGSPEPSNPPSNKPDNYVGCFTGSASSFSDSLTSDKLTPDNCQAWCKANKYAYAGMTKGNTCACISSDASLTATPAGSNSCSTECKGDSQLTCGGSDAWEVYEVKESDGTCDAN